MRPILDEGMRKDITPCSSPVNELVWRSFNANCTKLISVHHNTDSRVLQCQTTSRSRAAPESLIGKKQASTEGSGRKNHNPFWPEVKDIHDNKRNELTSIVYNTLNLIQNILVSGASPLRFDIMKNLPTCQSIRHSNWRRSSNWG